MLNSKKMNTFLVTFCLTSVLTCVAAAPAVSSVRVTFVSGNKATHYSHGTGDDGSVSHFNSLDDGTASEDHAVRKRSVTRRPPSDPGGVELLKVPNRQPASQPAPITSTSQPTPHDTNKIFATSTSTENILRTNMPTEKVSSLLSRGAAGRRVAFVKVDSDEITNDKEPKVALKLSTRLRSGAHHEERVLAASATTLKPKDTKAVKRSPQFHDNFLGSFDFPDFDEFGGHDFGHPEREFEESPHDNEPHHQHNNHGVESLAPDGVFLPPVPTQASNYVESDPYLAEPEVANYAVQHVPYFHEFPHKRTVLALNERREENGLEPNVLRSIRPFFAFFEINKRR